MEFNCADVIGESHMVDVQVPVRDNQPLKLHFNKQCPAVTLTENGLSDGRESALDKLLSLPQGRDPEPI